MHSPSGNEAFVQGLMEGHEYIWNTLLEEKELSHLKKQIERATIISLQEAKLEVFNKFIKLFRNIISQFKLKVSIR